jgi:peptidoglycan/xylan/chitin deacetylase (PgdA/CDA1 family)
MIQDRYAILWHQAVKTPETIKDRLRNFTKNIYLSVSVASQFELNLKSPRNDRFLRLVYCHYVFDDQKVLFRRQLDFMQSFGEFIDTSTCIDMITGKKEIDGCYFHLSFDDGFKNIYTNAAPILIERKIPALFFVPTRLVGATYKKAAEYCRHVLNMKDAIEIVTWQELSELMAKGFDIGSHTQTHARFSEISNTSERLKEEIQGAKNDIEKHLGQTCRYISWPFGRVQDTNEVSIDFVRESGYTACFSGIRGKVQPGKTNIFEIPRHHFEVQWPLSHMKYFINGGAEVNSRSSYCA